MNIRIAVAILSILVTIQVRPADSIAFETATVKANKFAGAGTFVGRQSPGRLGAENASLRELILYAYQLQSFQLAPGSAAWIDSDRWDIVAKLESAIPPAQGRVSNEAMALRTLLAERFKLVVHNETRQLPVYALVIARADRNLGKDLQASTIDCTVRACGIRGRIGSLQSAGASLSEFAASLSDRVGRPVLDRTGLTGSWDFTLIHSTEPSQIAPGVLAPGDPIPPSDPNEPSIFTALQEQLGLKLESARGPVEVLVIDSATPPIG